MDSYELKTILVKRKGADNIELSLGMKNTIVRKIIAVDDLRVGDTINVSFSESDGTLGFKDCPPDLEENTLQ